MSARRKNSRRRQALRAYSEAELARVLTMPEAEFGRAFGMTTTEVDQYPWEWEDHGPGKARKRAPVAPDYYHFRDNGSPVLAVAHLDTVVPPGGRAPRFALTQGGPLVRSGGLDDRLGAYVILSLLPRLGVTCDWLLTVGEETGQSTAAFFTPGKDYNWVIEFDRGGTDVVMYQYEDRTSHAAVQACNARVGRGSFSDICYLEHLGVKAFNWGVGYTGNYHSVHGYAPLYDTFAMVAKYLLFHERNAGVTMPHVPYVPPRQRAASGSGLNCDVCYAYGEVDPVTLVCAQCRSCYACGRDEDACRCFDDDLRDSAGDDVTTALLRSGALRSEDDVPMALTGAGPGVMPAASEDDGSTTLTWEEYMALRPGGENGPPAVTTA